MPRPRKCRKVCAMPLCSEFGPRKQDGNSVVVMSVDEYETIRLLDLEGLTQEQCAKQMEVARTTVQAIYGSARKKLAECIVNGYHLQIAGGDVEFCENDIRSCKGRCGCLKYGKIKRDETKGDRIMRIAVTYEDGEIFQHFGHTEYFKLYDVEEGMVKSSSVINTNGNGHGALGEILKSYQVDVLICGGIGAGAQNILAENGIRLYGGVSGAADQAVEALIADRLEYNPQVKCDHHDGHDGHEHTCGEHGCKH